MTRTMIVGEVKPGDWHQNIGQYVIGLAIVYQVQVQHFTSMKMLLSKRRVIRQQLDEFSTILSSVPQGIMLARVKSRSEVTREMESLEKLVGIDEMEAECQILPYETQYINSEL
mmetsp:Transcript_16969/g.22850  ORF Transcript_16969/g.22850 Transcript_16969/m.22850 type:complete len:114 (-) Transcript_16969:211-552(-)